MYTNEDLEGYNPSREWPEEDLPKAPEPQAAPTFSPELIRKGLSIHHLYCDWLKALGVDPCKEYANQGTQAILEAVVAGDTVCPICTKPLKTTQRLRSHIKGQHMESTPHECKICKKSFGDNYTLSLHEKTHGEKPTSAQLLVALNRTQVLAGLKSTPKCTILLLLTFTASIDVERFLLKRRTASSMRSIVLKVQRSLKFSAHTAQRRSRG